MFYKSVFLNQFGQMLSAFLALWDLSTARKIVAVFIQLHFDCCFCEALPK